MDVAMNTIAAWSDRLAMVIAASLTEFSSQVQDHIEIFAVDCHPWNGIIVFALLTRAEARSDPALCDPAEMAAWRHYDFATDLVSWEPVAALGSEMRKAYDGWGENRAATAERFIVACAKAAATDAVQRALGTYDLSERFRISVNHPDTQLEMYPPS